MFRVELWEGDPVLTGHPTVCKYHMRLAWSAVCGGAAKVALDARTRALSAAEESC